MSQDRSTQWTPERVLDVARGYHEASLIVAAAELDLFGKLATRSLNAADLAAAIEADPRATALLADALVAVGLLVKTDGLYSPAPSVASLFSENDPAETPEPGRASVLAMVRHQGNCMRSWAQLATVVRNGERFERPPSVRGAAEDLRSFIEAMEVTSRLAAPRVATALAGIEFGHLLDVGCGPGTWTRALLEARPMARATLFDLPDVIPIARRHMEAARLSERVDYVAGDLHSDDPLPSGCDVVWISAIAHMNSRKQNRRLYAKAFQALDPGGQILIRDIVMDDDHTSPRYGALFAINMLVNTEGGATWSLTETTEDLGTAGFDAPELLEGEREMDWIVRATRS